MSDKRYFTIVLPLNDTAQAMIRPESSRYQLRAMHWSCAAEQMKALLGKTCSMFAPTMKPAWCDIPLPFGVALGAVEPHEFLMRYFYAQKAQEDEIHARVKRIEAMGKTVFTKQLNDHVEMVVMSVNMGDPDLCREMEFANRFFRGDITAACGLYYMGLNQCHVEEDMEKAILSSLDEYAVCVAELEA